MANEQKPSKNLVRGSWFGQAEVSLAYLATNVGGLELVKEFRDAFHALQKSGGLIYTGATGTNVNDVAVLLIKN